MEINKRGLELVKEFEEPCVVACKHANPCGVGVGATIAIGALKKKKEEPAEAES